MPCIQQQSRPAKVPALGPSSRSASGCPSDGGPTHPQLVGLLAVSKAGSAGDGVHDAVGGHEPGGVLITNCGLGRQLVGVAQRLAGGAAHQAAQAHAAVQAVLEAAAQAAWEEAWGWRVGEGSSVETGRRTPIMGSPCLSPSRACNITSATTVQRQNNLNKQHEGGARYVHLPQQASLVGAGGTHPWFTHESAGP